MSTNGNCRTATFFSRLWKNIASSAKWSSYCSLLCNRAWTRVKNSFLPMLQAGSSAGLENLDSRNLTHLSISGSFKELKFRIHLRVKLRRA